MTRLISTLRRQALALSAGAAFTLFAAGALAQTTVRIGMITDRVGPAKPYAEPVAIGAAFAVKQLNAQGG